MKSSYTGALLRITLLTIVFFAGGWGSPSINQAVAQLQSQTGTLSGLVFDEDSSESIIGAAVRLEGTLLGAATDIDGRYIIRNIPAGTYTVIFSYVGYTDLRFTDVVIEPNGRHELNALLSASTLDLDAVTVSAARQRDSDVSVISDIRRSSQVLSGVSAQQIARSQDGNAAQVMQRVPGVTLVDSRFVMIRGLSERYNNVLINNTLAPSTEVDKRTFSFDLISSGSLDRMLISKSGSAELPGDFAGGVIKLFTVEQRDENFTSFSIGSGYRVGTTGRSYMQSRGSRTDFLGFDSGFRALPGDFPDSRSLQNSARNAQLRQDAALMLENNFLPESTTALADHSLGLAFGRNWQAGSRRWSNITTLDYSTGYQCYDRSFFRYLEWENRNQPILQRFAFNDETFQKETRLSLMSNFNLRLNPSHSISFKNLFNQIGENETILRNGTDFIQRPDDELMNYLLGYRSRSIYTGQLEGNHRLSENQSLNWTLGLSYLGESEPDLRRFRTFRDINDADERFTMQMPPSSNLFDTGRYFGSLDEISVNQGVNYEYRPARGPEFIRGGYLIDYRSRDFSSRYISYLYPGFFNPNVREELIRLPLDEIFAPENIRTLDGFVIEEGTRPIDSYGAESLTLAGYLSTEFVLSRMQLSGGLRVEHNTQQLNSQDDFQDIRVKNPVLSLLPFLSASLTLTERTQLRAGYSRTVNRPEFRELAPFVFYDYKMDAGRAGNPNLKTAQIDNADLRYEFYPRVGELISVGVFFKYFNNPIENRTIVTTESPQFSYINADYAMSYGAEIEFRKSMLGLTNSAFIDRFSVNANASVIFSEVNLGETAVAQSQTRALQGQSPYIVNMALYYDDQQRGIQASAVYNIVGPRIFSVGDVLFPTIYEMPRNSLDLSASYRFGRGSQLKAGISDLLNAPYRFYQDSDRNDRPETGRDHEIFSYSRGQKISLSYSYRF
ncbi:MAG: outer membrane beta-barrel protein [Candidatus Cyclonatronum sp.]|uniref:TonB-dependent receptor n=1 Tax=Cyclonatronum sp. TaxID=3024185 RepID=UPI0025C269D6|nr:TonB-dependent receptor [Cyclonatronum sp.]MCH8486728.1 outer membrane beta-barrel protein [Cyclonatronum sp.]